MKLVIQTQFKENYGAHDWDGRGECPQYWKFKGGDTYIIEVSLSEAQDPQFYDTVAQCIEHSSHYSEEYIIGESLVDDVDFVESDHCADWDSAIYARLSVDGHLNCEKAVKQFEGAVVGMRSWLQDAVGKRECSLVEYEDTV